jgi:hypothetical protein
MEKSCLGVDPLFFTIVDHATDQPAGLAAYLRIDPTNGAIEVGHIAYQWLNNDPRGIFLAPLVWE